MRFYRALADFMARQRSFIRVATIDQILGDGQVVVEGRTSQLLAPKQHEAGDLVWITDTDDGGTRLVAGPVS